MNLDDLKFREPQGYIEPFHHESRKHELDGGVYVVGFDCGQAQDFSAISILRKDYNRYEVAHLERLPLNTPYPAQVEHLAGLMNRRPLAGAHTMLAIDYTGVGRPVVDLASDRGLGPVGVSITAGNNATWNAEKTRVSVPKRDLVNILQVYAQNDRLKVASGLKFGPALVKELESFRVKIDLKTAHDSYGSWREGEHDDLILSVAIALWAAENKDRTEITRAPFRMIHRAGGRW